MTRDTDIARIAAVLNEWGLSGWQRGVGHQLVDNFAAALYDAGLRPSVEPLTPDELDALNTVLDVVVLTGATSDIAPYITNKADGFLAALAAVEPPLTVVRLLPTQASDSPEKP